LIYCAGVQNAPPGFLRLAGHPLRWRLLTELARTDRQVRELTGCWASRRAWSPSTWASSARAAWCRRGAVRPTAGTPTTALLAGTVREPWQFAVLAGAAVLLLGPALPQ
jgi:hypothetical protein